MNTAQVIPFLFESYEIRTQLIDDQPWFCVADVCRILGYMNSRDALAKHCREKGVAKRDTFTVKGRQSLTFIDEGNLYRLIIKSRKEEAQRFESWVCDEVLPAIRKHGGYVDDHGNMATLVSEVLGVTELTVLKGVIADKARQAPKDKRVSVMHTMHHRLHTRFNVQRTELIPHKDFAAACNFIAAYSLEGEFIGRDDPAPGANPLNDQRFLVWVDSNGQRQVKTIPNDACVMTHRDIIKAMVSHDAFHVTDEDLFEFARAAMTRLQERSQSQDRLIQRLRRER